MKKNAKYLISIFIVTICCFYLLYQPSKQAPGNVIISWGFIPNHDEQTPVSNPYSVKLLEEYNGIYVGNTREKSICFTFDLGFEAGYTHTVLDILKDNHIKAIFFLGGSYLKNKQLIHRMIAEGHLIGNHTDKHKDLPTLSVFIKNH